MTLTASCSNVNDKKITASASTISDDNTTDEIIPGGQVIGVTMESSGILVLGTGSVTGEDRHVYTPAGDTLKAGDIILMADGIELKRDANPQVVLNRLFNQSQLQTTFAINMLALVQNQSQPKILSLRHIIDENRCMGKGQHTRYRHTDLYKSR